MPRKHRIWYPGAMYHLTTRGNRKAPIFIGKQDFVTYLNLLHTYAFKHAVNILTYCLMGNHVHLQVQCDEEPPSAFMKSVHQLYAMYFNKKYETSGHVFQGRYKAHLIEELDQFLETSRYIHLNPVRADIVDMPIDYPYSSYKYYVTDAESSLVDTSLILTYFHSSGEAYQKYAEFPLELAIPATVNERKTKTAAISVAKSVKSTHKGSGTSL
ncbi:transposase [Fictibacillus iocasae]|uniref:Transposase n=1 Tax=Fictibacillus iocasae TaxID=2715437 RepID=A0ABW2NP70_9BACL